jgi:hypothetical protein
VLSAAFTLQASVLPICTELGPEVDALRRRFAAFGHARCDPQRYGRGVATTTAPVVASRREDVRVPIERVNGAEPRQSSRCRRDSLYRRRLPGAGLEGPPDAAITIDPSRFDGPDDLRASGIQRSVKNGDAIRLAPGAMS